MDVSARDPSPAAGRSRRPPGTRVVSHGQYVETRTGTRLALGRPGSTVDHNLSATWVEGRLLVLGGVDEEAGFDAAAPPEAWWWTPPD